MHVMLSLLEPNMMCLVQGFAGTKDVETEQQGKRKKPRKLSILRRRKCPSPSTSRHGDNLLHPDDARVTNITANSKQDKVSQQDLILSSPMTCSQDAQQLTGQQLAAAAATEALLTSTPGSSKARQKKFHRHFKQLDPEERVLDYFSCALVADILLQGNLYITKNYFAFYSNVFGYTTKLLIPAASVLSVTKEKTAFIIPNAVGITTDEEKHVFTSLLSRETTYKLMVQVWSAAVSACTATPTISKIEDSVSGDERKCDEEESSLSGSETHLESNITSAKLETPLCSPTVIVSDTDIHEPTKEKLRAVERCYTQLSNYISCLPQSSILLILSTFLVVLLFFSASVLIYRISRIQTTYGQNHLYNSRSFGEAQEFLSVNLDCLYRVRQSLEALSVLIQGEGLSNEKDSKVKFSQTQAS